MLRLENISKYYYSQTGVSLGLHKVNLSFRQGEFVAITGESGSGKSTLLNVISGLDTYEDGELYVEGKATSHFDDTDWEQYRREKIAFIFQNYNLIDSYTVLENVESALLVQGCPKEELRSRALSCIEKVDLTNRQNHRASELSSGQKQRLSIARALAKETPIIVADEPTGNLDSENGEQVMHLLKALSEEKLVIMVTHNSEQAERYVTRKIILHDGEIIADRECAEVKEVTPIQKKEEKAASIRESMTARIFAKMNLTSQRGKVFAIISFMLVSTFASFVFLGSFFSNLDDTNTKVYDDSAFYNSSNRRIVVRHQDNSPITDEDMETFRKLNYVEQVDRYDLTNDMYYFYVKNQDYKISYHTRVDHEDANDAGDSETVVLTGYHRFIHSSTCIQKEDLSAGHLPESMNQIVLYSEDASQIGKEILFYFQDKRTWGADQFIGMKMEVVGLLKEPDSQVYFSEEFCRLMMCNAERDYDYYCHGSSARYCDRFVPIYRIDPELKQGEVRASAQYLSKYQLDILQRVVFCPQENSKEEYIDFELLSSPNDGTSKIMDISKEDFEVIFQSFDTTQASLYITDYAYADDVIAELQKAGYDAISPLQVSSTKYDPVKVKERLVTLLISLVSLIVISLLEVVIVKSLLRLKKNDFIILRLIGLKQTVIHKINIFEMLIDQACAIVLTIAIVTILNLNDITIIVNLVKYYRIQHYCILILVNLLITLLIAWRFNQYLDKHDKVTALNEQ